MNDGTFDFNAFIGESKETLLNPKSYFSSMKTAGGLTEPIIKSVIYGAVAGAITYLLSVLRIGAVSGSIFSGSVGVSSIITFTLGSLVGMFVGAVVLVIISSICKANTDFEANARVVAAVMVILPVNSFLGFTSHISFYFGFVISLIVIIYTFWLLYNGLIETLKSKPETTKIVMYIMVAIFLILMLTSFREVRRANKSLNDFNGHDLKEQVRK